MKVDISIMSGIGWVIEAAAWTQGISTGAIYDSMSPDKWFLWLKAEHSPIRAFRLRIRIHDIPYYSHVHLIRHHVGVQPYVRSQRPDCINPVDYERGAARQDAPVGLMPDVNPQSLINISRKRLCRKADPVTRLAWEMVKTAIAEHENPYVAAIAEAMVPDCEYRGECYELKSCGWFLPQNQEKEIESGTSRT